jgi:hypothetical protein
VVEWERLVGLPRTAVKRRASATWGVALGRDPLRGSRVQLGRAASMRSWRDRVHRGPVHRGSRDARLNVCDVRSGMTSAGNRWTAVQAQPTPAHSAASAITIGCRRRGGRRGLESAVWPGRRESEGRDASAVEDERRHASHPRRMGVAVAHAAGLRFGSTERLPGLAACSRAHAKRPADCASGHALDGVTAFSGGAKANPGGQLRASYRAR